MKLPPRKEQLQFLKFVIVGGTNTAITYGIYLLLLSGGLHHQWALAGDYALGIVYGYLLNRYWTFRSQGKPANSIAKYCLTYGGMWAINFVLLMLFVDMFKWRSDLGQIPAMGISVIAVYFLQRSWVFKPA
jgi:putative flippase GtrA